MKHHRIVLTALAGTFLLLAAAIASQAYAATSTGTPSVTDAVAHDLQARATAATENGDMGALTACFTPDSQAALVEQFVAAGDRKFHEKMGDHPASSTISILDESTALKGAAAAVTVTAETDTAFSAGSKRSSDEGEVPTHTLSLSLVNGGWLVANDTYQDDGSVAYLTAAGAPSDLVAAAKSAQQDAISAAVARQAAQFGPAAPIGLSDVGPLYVDKFTYKRSAAVSYANTWWNSRNSYYNNFGDNDCANFVSQCVGASSGGAMWMFGSSSDPLGQQWWFHHSTMTDSQSWRYCPTQISAWRWAHPRNSPARYVVVYSSSKPSGYSTGDVAWLMNSSGIAYHAVFCTSFSGSTPLFSAHSSNRHNKPLSYWGAPSVRYGEIADTVVIN